MRLCRYNFCLPHHVYYLADRRQIPECLPLSGPKHRAQPISIPGQTSIYSQSLFAAVMMTLEHPQPVRQHEAAWLYGK